jgi:hypothetical protein
MAVENSAAPEVSRWLAQTLRVSLFVPSPLEATEEMWTAMAGVAADTTERRPRELTNRFFGKALDATVVLSSNPVRIDVFVQAGPPSQGALPAIVAGDANQLNEWLLGHIPALLDRVPKLTRFAFAGTLLQEVKSTDEGLSVLARKLKSVTVDERMRDFSFRVNWPVKMDAGFTINRLTTWSTVGVTVSALMGPNTPDAVLALNHYVQLEFDNNTMPAPEISLSSKDALEAFRFCLQLAMENMAEGEVISQ